MRTPFLLYLLALLACTPSVGCSPAMANEAAVGADAIEQHDCVAREPDGVCADAGDAGAACVAAAKARMDGCRAAVKARRDGGA